MAFLEKVAKQAAKLTQLEKDDIQLETEREQRIEAEQEKKFQEDMERLKKSKKGQPLPEFNETILDHNLSAKELRILAERARLDAAKWHRAYVKVEQEKEEFQLQLQQSQRRLRTLETDFAESEETSRKLRDSHSRVQTMEVELEERGRQIETLTNTLAAAQCSVQKQQSQIEEFTKRIEILTGARANSGRTLEDDLMSSYQQLSDMEGQLINLQTDLTYKTRESDSLRSQLESERTHAQSLQEEMTKREQELLKTKAQLMKMQSEDGLRSKAERLQLEEEVEHLRRAMEEVQENRLKEAAEHEAKLFRATGEIKRDYERALQEALEEQRKVIELKTGFFTPCLPARVVEQGWANAANSVLFMVTAILIWHIIQAPASINYKQCRQYLKLHTNRLYKSAEAAAAAGDVGAKIEGATKNAKAT